MKEGLEMSKTGRARNAMLVRVVSIALAVLLLASTLFSLADLL